MGLVLLILPFVAAEWVTQLTLVNDNSTYSDLTILSHAVRPSQQELDLQELMCLGDSLDELEKCFDFKSAVKAMQIWLTHLHDRETVEFKLQLASEIGASAVILLTNRTDISINSPYRTSLNVFSTHNQGLWTALALIGGVGQARLHSYNYCKLKAVECEWLEMLTVVFGVASLAWIGVIVWWLVNTHCCNRAYATIFHRLLSVLLILKAVNVLATFSLWTSCPFASKSHAGVTTTLLSLLRNQTQTLYETCFFSMLLILCKGLGLTRDDFTQGEFNYTAMLISVVYILDSGYYILMGAFDSVVFIMYVVLFFHCFAYCCSTFMTLRTQQDLAAAVGIASIREACTEKTRMFK
jgi:hypothetical protein